MQPSGIIIEVHMKECMTPLLENIKKMSLANKIEVMFFSFQKNICIRLLTNTVNAAFI